MTPERSPLLEEIALALRGDAPVEPGTMFRRPGLRTGRRIVAFLGRADRLNVKLPEARSAELVAAALAEPVVLGTRTMREWVAIPAGDDEESTRERWTGFAREALVYVQSLDD